MADTSPDSTYNDEFKKIHLRRAFEDIRELDEATQRALLTAWPFPLSLPDCNLSGVDSAVVVLRRIFMELPADSHSRGFVFGKKDKNAYGVGKEELDRFRALFRYAWHYLPDLTQCDPKNTLLPLEIADRQRRLLNILLPDRRMDQSCISFEALMESVCMQTAFWGRSEFQAFRDITGWQQKGATLVSPWYSKQRVVTPGPIAWKRDQESNLEEKINKMLCLKKVGSGNTTVLLPNWPTCLRVKITSSAPMTMDKMMEQQRLTLKGFRFLADPGPCGTCGLVRTEKKYYLAAAVAMRPSPQGSDVVVIGSETGMRSCLLANDPHLGRAARREPDDGDVMGKEGMLYFVLSPQNDDNDDVSMSSSSDSESEDEPQLTDDQKFRERLKAFDRMPHEGLTALSCQAEEALPEKIARGYAGAEEKFFR